MNRRSIAVSAICLCAAVLPLSHASEEAAPATMSGKPMISSTIEGIPELVDLKARLASDPSSPCLHNELAVALARKSFFDEALKEFRASLDLREDAVVYNNLGGLYLRTGRRSSAMSAFRKSLKLDPNYALAWYNLGSAYDARRKFKGAVRSYRRALELDPSLADPAVNPQVINNHYLVAVATERYIDTAGSLSLPMESSCGQAAGN